MKKLWICLVCFVVFLPSCTTVPAAQKRVRRLAAKGDFTDAADVLSHLPSGSYGKNNRLLEALDRAMIFHYAGNYQKSIDAFEQAKHIYDELYTKSVSKIAASWLWNDTALPYAGEDFERAAINIFQALNFIALGDYEGALVEARNAGSFLQQVNDRYEAGVKNSYVDDAFARFLMGLLYDSLGREQERNNAFISYKKALQIYENYYGPTYFLKPPMMLREKLFLAAKWMGAHEASFYRSQISDNEIKDLESRRDYAEVFLVAYRGQIVNKVSATIVLPGMDGLLTRVSFPRYRNSFKPMRLPVFTAKSTDGEVHGDVFKVQDWDEIARHNLEDRRLRILAKAVARPLTKQIMVEAAEDKISDKAGDAAGEIFHYAGNVYLLYSEQADLRAWDTLPSDMFLGRVLLPAGQYQFLIDGKEITKFTVAERDKKFIIHWLGY